MSFKRSALAFTGISPSLLIKELFLSRYFFSLHLNELIAFVNRARSVESMSICHTELIAFFLATLSLPKKSLKNTFDFFVNGLMIFSVSAGIKFSKKLFTKLDGCESVSVSVVN